MPLPPAKSLTIPPPAVAAIREFVSIFLPEFKDVPFHSTKLCWYTDSLDNSFVVGYPVDCTEHASLLKPGHCRSITCQPTPIHRFSSVREAVAMAPNSCQSLER